MKKLIFAGLSIMLLGASCSKQAEQPVKNQPDANRYAHMVGKAWQEVDGIGSCPDVPGNCHDMSVCWPAELSAMQQAVGEGPTGIATFFGETSNRAVFEACGVDENDFDNLTSGNYNIIIHVDANDPDLYYFLVGPTSTLSFSNPEYVLQIKAEE